MYFTAINFRAYKNDKCVLADCTLDEAIADAKANGHMIIEGGDTSDSILDVEGNVVEVIEDEE